MPMVRVFISIFLSARKQVRKMWNLEQYVDETIALLKSEQELTNNELNQVRKNLRFIGKDL